jgi:hypothetical protein
MTRDMYDFSLVLGKSLPINKYYTVVPITLGHPFYNENVTLWRGTI